MATMKHLANYKLVFLGDQSVGKTSIITAFMLQLELIFCQKQLGMKIRRLFVCNCGRDTAGQERFKSLIPSYIRDSSVALIVYDVASRTNFLDHISFMDYTSFKNRSISIFHNSECVDKESFLNTSKWIEDVRAERGNHVIIVLVGNKTDLVNKRQVSIDEGDNKAREFGALFIETSAKVSLCSVRLHRRYKEMRYFLGRNKKIW